MKIIYRLPNGTEETFTLSESDDCKKWTPIPCDGTVAIQAPGAVAIVDEYAMDARTSRAKGGQKSAGIPKREFVTEPVKPEEVIRDYDRLISDGRTKFNARRRIYNQFKIQERTFFAYQKQIRATSAETL